MTACATRWTRAIPSRTARVITGELGTQRAETRQIPARTTDHVCGLKAEHRGRCECWACGATKS